MNYEKLFTKGRIGSLEIKNRIVMPAMGVSFAQSTGEASDDMIRYYEERAKGGCGLIITEITRIDDEYGVGTSNQLAVTDARHIPQLERLVDAVHKYDCKLFVQLHHPGRQTHSQLIGGKQIVAPSAIACKITQEVPRALTTEECEGIMRVFVKGAVIAKTAGCDGVELHAAHGYLLNQFLSPYSNHRTDKYGGSFFNRLRILSEIITAIKYLCGAKFPVVVRIDGDEFVEGGLKLPDAVKIARALESYGADAINVSSGTYESAITIIEPSSYAQGWRKHLADTIKKSIKIPVLAVNTVKKPEFAEQLLKDGVCDFVCVGRGQLADAKWANKARKGDDEAIRKCIGCLYCFEELSTGRRCKCAINARLGREREFETISKTGGGKTVAVVGGGPGGMEAARVLAERGFKVVLFEKADRLGGMLNLGNQPPFKEKLTWLADSMTLELKRLGVEIRYHTEATVDLVKSVSPVGVFVACGAQPVIPKIPGCDRANVVTAESYLAGKATVGQSAAVIGSGLTGCETAELLAHRGHKVAVVEMLKEIGPGVNRTILYDLMSRFKKYDPTLKPQHKLVGVTDQGAVLMNMADQSQTVLPVDTVVLALGVCPDKNIVSAYEAAFEEVRVIGDASCGGRIAEAIADGYTKAFVF